MPRVGSQSMHAAMNVLGGQVVDAATARTHSRRVAFIRDPIERLNSTFNLLSRLTYHNNDYDTICPPGIIKAYSRRMHGDLGWNEHLFQNHADFDAARAGMEHNPQNEAILDQQDWVRFVNHMLTTPNEHWTPQFDLLSDGTGYIPTETYRFEDISSAWASLFGQPFPSINAFPQVPHADHRLAEITAYYAKDIALRASI